MQYTIVLISIFMGWYALLSADHEAVAFSHALPHTDSRINVESERKSHHHENDAVVDEILALIEQKGIQTPSVNPPSPFMKWIRSVGISLLYKYHAVKTWITSDS